LDPSTLSDAKPKQEVNDSELNVCFRKLSKKDAVTKTKALDELALLFEARSSEDLVSILPAWVWSESCFAGSLIRFLLKSVPRQLSLSLCHVLAISGTSIQSPRIRQ
jgi:hypothetical protein